jgi:glycosyltransferase involved in cell wall biosynthesis
MGRALAEMGWSVHAVGAGHPDRQLAPNLTAEGVPIGRVMSLAGRSPLRLREDWLFAANNGVFDLLTSRVVTQSDVCYCYSTACLHTLTTAARRVHLTVLHAANTFVPRLHSLLEGEYRGLGLRHPPIGRWATSRAIREYALADMIRVESSLVLESLIDGGISSDKIHLVPASVDLNRFQGAPYGGATFNVLFVGSFSVRKGFHHLVAAWELFADADTRLILHGAISNRWGKRMVQRLEEDTRIVFAAGDTYNSYHQASVCVVPSIEDGFALVVLEAMAAGVPVVVSDMVGAKDAVRDGIDGYVVPAGNPRAIVDRLQNLRSNPALLERMAGAARERARGYTSVNESERLADCWGFGPKSVVA